MMSKNRIAPELEVAEETARILFLAYGHDAVHMAARRCAELKDAGDKARRASWRRVLMSVRELAAANRLQRGTIH